MNTENLLRALRRHRLLWEGGPKGEQVSRLIRRAKERLIRERRDNEARGVYSGLTRAELRKSRTCETDWY